VIYWDKTESNEIKEISKRLFQDVTPETSKHDLKRFKDTTLFLTPMTQKLHESLEKAKRSTDIVYITKK
jgi:hypothetical protein